MNPMDPNNHVNILSSYDSNNSNLNSPLTPQVTKKRKLPNDDPKTPLNRKRKTSESSCVTGKSLPVMIKVCKYVYIYAYLNKKFSFSFLILFYYYFLLNKNVIFNKRFVLFYLFNVI